MSKIVTVVSYFFSSLGVILGLSACVAFYIYGNNFAVFWSCFSAALAFLNLHLHSLHLKHKLEEWHTVETLSRIKEFGFLLFVVLISFFVWYMFIIIYHKEPVYPIKDSMVITSVWIFMSAKWAFFLYRAAHRYGKLLLLSHRLLVPS